MCFTEQSENFPSRKYSTCTVHRAFSKSAQLPDQWAASSRGLTISFQSENNITIMIKLMACHLTGYVKITNNMEISVGKCRKIHQVCGKQTGLCGKISTVDKIDNYNSFQMYRTTVKWKVCQSFQQFKVFNRMHIIFASLDISLILLGYYFLTSISLIAQFFYSILAHFMC